MGRGDEALNPLNPAVSGERTAVEFYEVPIQTVT
jgi:hypothetical protein